MSLNSVNVNNENVWKDTEFEKIIRLEDWCVFGGGPMDFFYPIDTKEYINIRTRRFKIYKNTTLYAIRPFHLYLSDEENYSTFLNEGAEKHIIMLAGQSYTPDTDKYAFLLLTVNYDIDEIMSMLLEYASIKIPRYIEEDFWIDEPNSHNNAALDVSKYYQNNGLWAYGCETRYYRGIAYPYEGPILYRSDEGNGYVSIAQLTNGENEYMSCQVCFEFSVYTGEGNMYFMWGLDDYIGEHFTFDNTFQQNLNGWSYSLQNNILTVKYVYECQIYENTAGPFNNKLFQAAYNRCRQMPGGCLQTGHGLNIDFYGKGFSDYDEYFRFARDLNDDFSINDHEIRIVNLESGGGGGEPADFDWSKGFDLLEFGQEYLYAWLNALKNGNSFKVLFTGDSTTAYYNGTADGLKEIFQECMVKAGYTNGTYLNRAVSGINASTWYNNYLTGDISEQPTLYIIRHGFNNESGNSEDEMAQNFRTVMIRCLEQIRQTLTISNTSIILMTPNTSDDNVNHRGYSMKQRLDPIIRQLAREYGCGFIDTFRLWYDAGQYADPMYDDPYGDHRSIHPTGLMNRIIISKLFEFCVPFNYRNRS